MLRLAAREADIVHVNYNLNEGRINPKLVRTGMAEATDEKLGWIREAAGDRLDGIELGFTVFFASVTDDRESLASALAPSMGFEARDVLEMPHFLIGTLDQIEHDLRERRDRYGFSHVILPGETADELCADRGAPGRQLEPSCRLRGRWPPPSMSSSRATWKAGRARCSRRKALEFVAKLHREFAQPPPGAAAVARRSARRGSTRASCPNSWSRPAPCATPSGGSPARPTDLQDRRVEITGPTDRKMLINALNSGRARLHGRLRGRQLADLVEPGRRPGEPDRRHRAADRFHEPGRQGVPAQRQGRDAAGAAARLAPRRASRGGRRQADVRRPVRLRPVLLSQRRAPA